MVGFVGVTAIDTNLAEVTVKVWAGLVISSLVAVISVDPAETELTRPEVSMVATPVSLDDQVVVLVMSRVLPSE